MITSSPRRMTPRHASRPTARPSAAWPAALSMTLSLALSMTLSLALSRSAQAQGFSELGQDLTPNLDSAIKATGQLRLRAEALNNLDLDHGLTPSGQPLYPVPLGDPSAQTLHHADMRLRTDLSMYAPYGSVRVNVRLDLLDNLTLGSTPQGGPLTTTTQRSPEGGALRVKRAYGEALTPFGVIVAGRMANTWGLGMLANGGDCPDCDSSDAADRFAFITSQWEHFVAVAYDIAYVGPNVSRRQTSRRVDLDPSDDVTTLTVALLRQRDALALKRRNDAGMVTFDYGLTLSWRSQDNDIPAHYVPTATPVGLDRSQVMRRGFRAAAYDGWARLVGPWFRMELEIAALTARIEEASLVPGVRFDRAVTSSQLGMALETEFGRPESMISGGLNLGFASGDRAYGFGANPRDNDRPARPGDLEGPQANPPFDTTVNNFRFHPDYRIDQILFREIIGTVTDAIYIRPHLRWDLWREAPGTLTLQTALVASRAVHGSSTPSGQTPLGVELDPSLIYTSRDGFGLAMDYAVLFPLSGLDNPSLGLGAKPAQLFRLRLSYGF